MAQWLLHQDGLFVGSSACLNCVGVVKAVKAGLVPPGGSVVTILCDSGVRHLSKFWNPEYLTRAGLLPSFLDGAGKLMVPPEELPTPLEFVAG